jgi:NitT/TauT family transport system permease protein
VVLAAWETAYRLIGWHSWIFPAPSHVFDALLGLLNIHTAFGDPLRAGWPRPATEYPAGSFFFSPLIVAIVVSSVRIVVGFVLSLFLGVFLGLAMWRWAWLDRLLGPLFLGLQTLPSVCWVPLAILLFGLNEAGILFVMVMGSFFAVAVALRDGLATIPPLYWRAGQMLGARGWRMYRYVMFPASLPAMASSLRQGFSFAWRSLLGAELILFAAHPGIGYLLAQGRETVDVAKVVAMMAVMVAVGMLADRLAFARLERAVLARFGLVGTR